MTIDEAIKHCEETAEKYFEYGIESECYQCGKEHEQLAEWLTDYKELKNSVGAVKLELLKEAQAELEKRGNMLHDTIAELEEAKRLLKSAIDEWSIVCEWGNCGEYCGWYVNGQCSQKWSKEAEALKLIGEEGEQK